MNSDFHARLLASSEANCKYYSPPLRWIIVQYFDSSSPISFQASPLILPRSIYLTLILSRTFYVRQNLRDIINTLNVVPYQIPDFFKKAYAFCNNRNRESTEKSWKAFNTYARACVSRKFVIKRFLYARFLHEKLSPQTYGNHCGMSEDLFNPLTTISDQVKTSPYNINTISSRQVMRIKKNTY